MQSEAIFLKTGNILAEPHNFKGALMVITGFYGQG